MKVDTCIINMKMHLHTHTYAKLNICKEVSNTYICVDKFVYIYI